MRIRLFVLAILFAFNSSCERHHDLTLRAKTKSELNAIAAIIVSKLGNINSSAITQDSEWHSLSLSDFCQLFEISFVDDSENLEWLQDGDGWGTPYGFKCRSSPGANTFEFEILSAGEDRRLNTKDDLSRTTGET